MGILAELARLIASKSKNIGPLMDSLQPSLKRGASTPEDHKIIMNELLSNAGEEDVTTHLFRNPEGVARAGFQLSPRDDRTYIPYMFSLDSGLGHQALEDAYRTSTQKPVFLYSTDEPKTLEFYRKQPGWVESNEDGVSKFTRKAKGGLIQMRGK